MPRYIVTLKPKFIEKAKSNLCDTDQFPSEIEAEDSNLACADAALLIPSNDRDPDSHRNLAYIPSASWFYAELIEEE